MKREFKGNLAAVLVGVAMAIILALTVDTIFGWVNGVEVSKSRFFPRPPNVDGLGWSVRNQGKLRSTGDGYAIDHREVFDGTTIFDVTYNYDHVFRRKVPAAPDQDTDKFVLFFGGSQTFGEGLNDPDTIPARIQNSFRDYRVYNYAYKGYGPHQMLRKLETRTLSSEVPESQGVAFYQYFGFHLQRAVGTMSYVGWAGGGAPYYAVGSDGQLEYRGSFATGRFFTTFAYWLLGRSAIAKHFRVDLPRQMTRDHRELFCRVLQESRDVFLEQYPGSRFIVIVSIMNGKQDPIIQGCLQPSGIEFIDIRGIESGRKDLAFPHNGHFTPAATRLIAEQLSPLLAR